MSPTTMSGVQFDALPYDEGRRWELLRQYLASGKGVSFADVEFALSDLLRLRPDVCVLLKEKAMQLNPDRVPVPGAPDIAIEVISPTERAVESHDKIRAYLRNGAIEAWQVFPRSRTVEVYNVSGSTIFDSTQNLTSSLLPDLNLPVASLFE
jgi:Uma2 family endonuclease